MNDRHIIKQVYKELSRFHELGLPPEAPFINML